MSTGRNHGRSRKALTWVVALALVLQVAMAGLAGIAAAAAGDVAGQLPFTDAVICTSNGAQAPGAGDVSDQGAAGALCDLCFCTSMCCAAGACDRVGAFIVLRQPLGGEVGAWSLRDEGVNRPSVTAAFSSRAPPISV